MNLTTLTSMLILNAFSIPGSQHIPALVPVNMDSVVIIEDFDDGEVLLDSFPGEDADPDSFELCSDNTYEESPFSLRLFGNTWKIENIDPIVLDPGDVWQVSTYPMDSTEIQGFGLMDSQNALFYSFAGFERLDTEQWVTVYQGAFNDSVWNTYQLPVADDWMAYFDYLPTVTYLVFINDSDTTEAGTAYFDLIMDITDAIPTAPLIEISYAVGTIYRNVEGLRSVDVQFYSTVTDPDSEEHLYFWDFGDDSTSSEPNPLHTFLVLDDHPYTVLLEVVDDTDRWGQATCQIDVDPGPTTYPITMNFVGDVSLGRWMRTLIDQVGVEAIFEPTKSILGDAAQITVANLECPFTDATTEHPTKSYTFKARPEDIAGIVYAGIDVVSIGNNHILDYLYPGLQETQAVLDSSEILYSGAGVDSYEAYLPVFHSKSGVTIAFLASSDRTGQYFNYQPYLNAGYNKPGFALMEPYYVIQQIESVQNYADLVVMEFHAGSEYKQYPRLDGSVSGNEWHYEDEDYDPRFVTPTRQDRELRQLCIDEGADIVICHHPHVLQGVEVYEGKLIAHSLGNFAFDQRRTETSPSILLDTKVDETGFYEFEITPIYIDHFIPISARGELGLHILDYMARRSKELDTYLDVNRQTVRAEVILDTLSMPVLTNSFQDYAACGFDGGLWTSPPIRLKRTGHISSIDVVSPGQPWDYRLGRETVWFGNFEDEGSDLWLLNSTFESYDSTDVYQGERCVRHDITSHDYSNVVTNLEWPNGPYDDNSVHHMLHGYIKTQNARDVTIEAKYLNYAYNGDQIGETESIGSFVNGDTPWDYFFGMLTLPADTPAGTTAADSIIYIDIRCNSQVPDSGEAFSWFDNVGIIEWTDWSSLSTPVSVTNPNDFYYIQLRTPTQTSEVNLSYTETSYGITPLPNMSVDPTSFEVILNPEGATSETVTIHNYGDARLDFTVASNADWLTPNAWTGSVEPGADSLITLTFDATGLGEGIYTSSLIVRSNDPDQSLLFLQTVLTVTNSPIVHVDVTPSGRSIELSWPAVPGATLYNIYRSETPFGPWSLVATETATSFVDENAVALFEQAYYQVTAELPSGAARSQGQIPLSPPARPR